MPVLQSVQHDDERFMAAAIRLARCHLGLTGANPSVGALVVRNDGQGAYIVGRGVTACGGRPHAETMALAQAGALARAATVYVTLEPCSHYGKTPPCAEALVAAGVGRVVIAMRDPDPRVNGKGVEHLRQMGIEVAEQVLTDVAREALSAYLCRQLLQRPEVTLKLAISADGCIGREDAGNIAVSGPVSHAQSHLLRAENDAILIGIGTAIADNPRLDCRLPGLEKRSPVRVVVDSRLRLSPGSQLARSARQYPLWIVCAKNADPCSAQRLEAAGCRIIRCPMLDGEPDLLALLSQLGQAGINSVLVEGGQKMASSLWGRGLVDRLMLFHSPVIIGAGGIKAPDFSGQIAHYKTIASRRFGEDRFTQWKRIG